MSPTARHFAMVGIIWAISAAGTLPLLAQPSPKPQAQEPPATSPTYPAPPPVGAPPASLCPTAEAPWTAKDWGALLSGPLGLLGALVAVWFGARNSNATIAAAQRNSEAALIQKSNETELESLGAALGAFYGPFLQLSEANALLAREFRARQPDPEFRLLVALLDPDWRAALSETDRTIVSEIVQIDGELERLIREKAGQVEEVVLAYLARATAHFRVMRLAWDGALDNDPERIKLYAYPRQLDAVLKAEVARIQSRCEQLRARPGVAHGPLSALRLPAGLELSPWPQDGRSQAPTTAASAHGSPPRPADGPPHANDV